MNRTDQITEYLKINLGEAEYNYYINFLESLPQVEKDALALPSEIRTPNDIKIIQEIFKKIQPIQQPLYVYRCYRKNVTFQNLLDQPINGVLSSTTISFNYANQWCWWSVQPVREGVKYEFETRPENLIICILIPPGTKVIPLIADYLIHKRKEYEILLSDTATLHYTGTNKRPTGYQEVPVFLYLPGNDITENNKIIQKTKIYTIQLKVKESDRIRLEQEAEAERIRLEQEAQAETSSTDILGGGKINKKTKKNKKNKKSKKNQRKGKLIKTKTTTKKNK
jgi:hypothetical protein